jgi:hypothetical protein
MNEALFDKRPVLDCPRLPDFDADSMDLAAVRQAFVGSAACDLGQGWLPATEPQFRSGRVNVGWRGDRLLLLAELVDDDVYSNSTGPNQRFWELGDVFEMFLRPATQASYAELQVTPNGHQLQLRYEDATAVDRLRKLGSIESVIVPGEGFESRVWLRPEERRWVVFAGIPSATVCGRSVDLGGAEWIFSFSRYDYTRGAAQPVISSSSPHPVADFHRQADWGRLRFQI